jgi:hypothetical protein
METVTKAELTITFNAAARPKIVCLCGSTRFWREFQRAGLTETLAGNIVLSIGAASGTDDEHFGNLPREEYDRVKTMLDQLHLRKIDMADEVLILNPGGYIGESTGRELMYAVGEGKEIRLLEPIAPRPGWQPKEPATKLPMDIYWRKHALSDSGEWHLYWQAVDECGEADEWIDHTGTEIDWPFPVNWARAEDMTAAGFEVV